MSLAMRLTTTLMLLTLAVAAAASSTWSYRNTQYGFCMTLPSSSWHAIHYVGDGLVAFGNTAAREKVGVMVRHESEAAYQTTVSNFASLLKGLQRAAQPEESQGRTAHGNHYHYLMTVDEDDHGHREFVGMSHVYLLHRNETVVTTFQAFLPPHGAPLSKEQLLSLEADAKAICLSVDQL